MADSKLTQLPLNNTPTSDDLLYMVDDPAGTPVSQGTTFSDASKALDASAIPNNAVTNADNNFSVAQTFQNGIDSNNNEIINVADPSLAQDAATKNYVDLAIQGVSRKDPVTVAATSNITLSGEQTIDGVLTSTDRVLVTGQTDATENGIYISAAGAWSRSEDSNTGEEIVGAHVTVLEGTVNATRSFQNTNSSINLGVTNITFVRVESVQFHNDLGSIQGGQANEYFHLTNAEHTNLTGASTTFTELTVTNDLTVDTDTFYVDSTNDRVAINKVPDQAAPLDVKSLSVSSEAQRWTSTDNQVIGSIREESDTSGSFNLFNAAESTSVRILSNGDSYFNGGNVGIGTASPEGKLDITSADFDVMYLNRSSTGSSSVIMQDQNNDGALIQSQANGGFSVFTRDNSINTERLNIGSTGNVGIGVSSPNEKLEVDGTIKSIDRAIAGSATAGITMSYDTSTELGRIETWQSKPITLETAGAERVRVDASGNVGIGTTSPGSKLNVQDSSVTTSGVIAEFGSQVIPNGLQVITSDGNLEWGLNAINSRSLVFQTNQSEKNED